MYVYENPEPNETTAEKLVRKARELANNGRAWYYRNREDILLFGPIVFSLSGTLVRVVGKRINLHKQEDIKNLYCYDRSLGHYWALRRELTNKEWLMIDQRKKNGERLSDILAELKVLK